MLAKGGLSKYNLWQYLLFGFLELGFCYANIFDLLNKRKSRSEHIDIETYNHGDDLFSSAFVLITNNDTKVITTPANHIGRTHNDHNRVGIALLNQYGPPGEPSKIYGRTPGGIIYTLYVVVFRGLTEAL